MGFGIVSKDEQKGIVDDLTTITGQRPLLCKAKKSISHFKLREKNYMKILSMAPEVV